KTVTQGEFGTVAAGKYAPTQNREDDTERSCLVRRNDRFLWLRYFRRSLPPSGARRRFRNGRRDTRARCQPNWTNRAALGCGPKRVGSANQGRRDSSRSGQSRSSNL